MQASLLRPFAINRTTMFYIGAALLMVLFLLSPQHAFASEGTGGSLPYERRTCAIPSPARWPSRCRSSAS